MLVLGTEEDYVNGSVFFWVCRFSVAFLEYLVSETLEFVKQFWEMLLLAAFPLSFRRESELSKTFVSCTVLRMLGAIIFLLWLISTPEGDLYKLLEYGVRYGIFGCMENMVESKFTAPSLVCGDIWPLLILTRLLFQIGPESRLIGCFGVEFFYSLQV